MRQLFPSTSVEVEEAAYTKADAVKDYKKWQKANTAYHNGAGIMSDAEFDRLTKKLKPFYPTIEKTVGAEPMAQHPSARKVRLETPMSSLDKAYDKDVPNKVRSKIGKYTEAVISEKVDGYSLQYCSDSKGNKTLFTRGKDGVGQDVSHLIRPMEDAQLLGTIRKNEKIRFELAMPKGSLQGLDDGDPSRERNAIASIVNARTPNIKILKRAVAVALSFMEPASPPAYAFKQLKQRGWRIPKYQVVKTGDLTAKLLGTLYKSYKDKAHYAIDGLVVSANISEKPSITNPKHSFAFKMNEGGVVTDVVKIEWNVSRYGQLKPVIIIKPIDLDGAKITRATAHNAKYVKDNKIGPGAKVEIIRSGGIIPYIAEVITPAAKAALPKAGTYEWDSTKVNIMTLDESHADTSNAKQLQTFFSKIGVVGFGPAVAALVSELSIPDIINLKQEDWLNYGAGNSVSSKMPKGIRVAIRSTTIPKLMAYSGVFGQGFGESSAKDLWDVVTREKPSNKAELQTELALLSGWSNDSALSVAKRWGRWVKWFNALPVKPTSKAVTKAGTALRGKVFVFTNIRDKKLEQDIEEQGGIIGSSVTRSTTHVIYKDGETSLKLTKAKEMGLRTIPYSKARAKLNLE